MKNKSRFPILSVAIALIGALPVIGAFATTPAVAGERHTHLAHTRERHSHAHHAHHPHDRHGLRVRTAPGYVLGPYRRIPVYRRAFVVPAAIHGIAIRNYRPYFAGHVYYRAHRHTHDVYRFPVLTSFGYGLRPHYYCEGELFVETASYSGSRIDFHVRF